MFLYRTQAVPGSAKAGQTPIYVNAAFPHLPGTHTSPEFPKTAYESFNIGLKSNPKLVDSILAAESHDY
jgi:hypothetical protein